MAKVLVEFLNVSKSYGTFKAVDGLDLKVLQGDVYGFLGPNGSGKSTSLRMLLGLIKPESGEVKIFGKSLSENPKEILSKVGCIIEKPDFYLFLSALDNLKILGRLSGIQTSSQKLKDILEIVGLENRGKDKVRTFSHGMKQRLGLAQALLHDPELIILDEPNTGLDPQGIIDMRKLITTLQKEQGKTIILSSHILFEIELIASRMIILNKGKKVIEGSVNELLSNEDLVVTIEVSEAEKTAFFLASSEWRDKIEKQDNKFFSLRISKEEIPALQEKFHAENIRIYSVQYRKQLEDYFLKLTN